MSQKERLERELEQLTKTYKAGIINEREYQKGKERVESKLVMAKEQIKKDQEGKKIITDILGENTVDEQVKQKKSEKIAPIKKDSKEDSEEEDINDKKDINEDSNDKEDRIIEEEFIEEKDDVKPEKKVTVKKPVKKVVKKPVKKVTKKVKNKKKVSKKKKKFDNYYEDEDDSTFTKVVIFAGIICILLLLVLVKVFMDNSNEQIDTKNLEGINGTVTMEMYIDFSCEHCSNSWQKLVTLKKIYGDNLIIKVKHFPMSIESIDIANAVICAKDQGKHMQYIKRIFDNKDNLDINSLKNFAWAEGLDIILFHSCVDEQEHRDKIAQDIQEGYDLGVRGSPTYYIDDERIVGDQTEAFFSGKIDAKLGLN